MYNILAITLLLYDWEMWILKEKDVRRTNIPKMKFMRRTSWYISLDHRRNEDFLAGRKLDQVEKKLAQNKQG